MSEEETVSIDFIRRIINDDLESGKNGDKVHTRFPPEPNGYLHIGHAKSICLNFGIANEYAGAHCNLRFDDTNPCKEEQEFVDSIQEDIKWLGFDWEERLFFASDYYDTFYEYAVHLIKEGKAYVDSLSAEEIRAHRGTLTEPGKNSPYRDRSVEENLDLFEKMKAGEFEDGAHILRAKIDMASPNMNMRDPALYRIRHEHHHRTGDKWCIYPMYDYAHCISDALEGITHSICTLEFEDHRPLYDWVLDNVPAPCHPQQIEFARLNLTYVAMSKRWLGRLVDEGHVAGWDDPRMPTLAGLRRRGVTPAAIREMCDRVGVAKANSVVDYELLNFCLREDLNHRAHRGMAVLKPLKLVITNYPEGKEELLEGENNPNDESAGKREIPFCGELYIDRDDYMDNAPKKWFRFSEGKEVRLKHAYYVTCDEVIRDDSGEPIELRCSYDPQSHGGWSEDGRKVKGTVQWVSARHAKEVEVRMYDHLFKVENPMDVPEGKDFTANLNENSLEVVTALVEPMLAEARAGDTFQFLRIGYFCADSKDSRPGAPVFNRTVAMRDSWAKKNK